MASLSQGRTAAAQCGLFTYKLVPVIFEPPCSLEVMVPLAHGDKITKLYKSAYIVLYHAALILIYCINFDVILIVHRR